VRVFNLTTNRHLLTIMMGYCRRLKAAEQQVGALERRSRDAEGRLAEVERGCREESLRLLDTDNRLKAAEVGFVRVC
jgi:hypothetical protein